MFLAISRYLPLVAALCGLGLFACGGGPLRMNIVVESEANNNSPVIISALVAYDAAVHSKLLDLTAAQWFARREQLLRDFGPAVDETLWELVPGQQLPAISRPLRRRGQGVLFANYRSSGAHRYLFNPDSPQKITCGVREMMVTQ